jgi:hypothetical protein
MALFLFLRNVVGVLLEKEDCLNAMGQTRGAVTGVRAGHYREDMVMHNTRETQWPTSTFYKYCVVGKECHCRAARGKKSLSEKKNARQKWGQINQTSTWILGNSVFMTS